MAAAITILGVLLLILAAACWAADKSHEDEINQIHRDIAALKAAANPPRPKPPTVESLYPERKESLCTESNSG